MSTKVNYIGDQIENLKSDSRQDGGVIPFFSVEQVKSFRSIFGFLNNKDRDVLYLIFVSKKKQEDVQKILKRSQPSLCYDIKRIRKRLKYIFYIHSVSDIFVEFVSSCQDSFTSEEIEIMTLMFYTSSFTMTASVLGLSQVRTRYSYNKCVDRMADIGNWEIHEILMVIRENLNSIKRTYKSDRPSFNKKY